MWKLVEKFFIAFILIRKWIWHFCFTSSSCTGNKIKLYSHEFLISGYLKNVHFLCSVTFKRQTDKSFDRIKRVQIHLTHWSINTRTFYPTPYELDFVDQKAAAIWML